MLFVVPILISALAGLALLAFGAAPYALLASLAVPILYVALQRPMLLCAIAVASQAWSVFSFGLLTIFKILMMVALFQMAILRRRGEPLPQVDRPFVAMAAVLLAWCCFCEMQVMRPDLTFLLEAFACAVMYPSLSQLLKTERDLQTLFKCLIVNAILVGIWVVLEAPWRAMSSGAVRAVGPCGQPNTLGQLASSSAPFAVAILLDHRESKWWRIAGLAAVLCTLYMLLASASRTAFLTYVLSSVIMAIGAVWSTKASKTLVAMLLGVMSVAFVFAPKSFEERVLRSTQDLTDVKAGDYTTKRRRQLTSYRDEHAKLGLQMASEKPLTGWGYLGFATHWQRLQGTFTSLHSAFVGILVAFGFPAGLLFIGLVLWSLIASIRASINWRGFRPYPLAIASAAIGSVLAMTVSTNFFKFWDWGPLLIGLIVWKHRARFLMLPAANAQAPWVRTEKNGPVAGYSPNIARG